MSIKELFAHLSWGKAYLLRRSITLIISPASQGSFHGAAISLVQHQTNDNPSQLKESLFFDPTINTRSLAKLPSSFCSADPVALPRSDFRLAEVMVDLFMRVNENSESYTQEDDWLRNATNTVSEE